MFAPCTGRPLGSNAHDSPPHVRSTASSFRQRAGRRASNLTQDSALHPLNQSPDPIFLMIANNLGDLPLTEFADRYNKFRGSLFLLFWSFRLFLLRAARANPARDRHKHSLVDLFLQNATRLTLRADAPNDDANAIKHNQNIQTPEIEMFSSLSRRALASIFQFIIDL